MTYFDPQARAVDTLARTIWGEARGEGRIGMEAVASVVLNRVAHPRWWGTNIYSVCTARLQFSCWNQQDPNFHQVISVTGSDGAFVTALQVAEAAAAGRLSDRTGGADSYYAIGLKPPPAWAARAIHTVDIGHHEFYRVLTADESGAPSAPCCSIHSVTADQLNQNELDQLQES